MSTCFEQILALYGVKAIMGVVVVGALSCLLAHCAAKPDSEVSLLWGLAHYTKRPLPATSTGFPTLANEKSDHVILRGSNTDREYLLQRPIDLLKSVSSLTSRDAQLFQEKAYRGRWIKIRGPVSDIDGSDDLALIVLHVDGVEIRFILAGNEVQKANQMSAGETVTLEGRFAHMDKSWISFTAAELS